MTPSTTTSAPSRALLVTDESTRDEVADAMAKINAVTKLTHRVVGTAAQPTLWDRRHELLNAMLTDWQTREA